MRDRKAFETRTLPNSIRVYHYPEQSGYAYLGYRVPYGHAHNAGDILPGTAHFLEHMLIQRSKLFPEYRGFKEWTGLKGGCFGGRTSPLATVYDLEIPTRYFGEALEGFLAQLYQPLILEEDIKKHRKIIRSERLRRRWFPRENEIDCYASTQWMRNHPVSIRQTFGEDDDLAAISAENLLSFRETAYHDESFLNVIVAGEADFELTCAAFAAIPTSHQLCPWFSYQKLGWEHEEYHEHAFKDTSRFELRFGNINLHADDPFSQRTLGFFGRFLTNPTTGALSRWIREEKNWSYDMQFTKRTDGRSSYWSLFLPLQDRSQLDEVRANIAEKIEKAIGDRHLVEQEVERVIDSSVFMYRSLMDVVEAAWHDIGSFGRVISEAEDQQNVQTGSEYQNLYRVWQEDIHPAVPNGFCAIPL